MQKVDTFSLRLSKDTLDAPDKLLRGGLGSSNDKK
jgi:hypothetical protein